MKWAAAFAPDGKHILVSSHNGSRLTLHKTSDGAVVHVFDDAKFSDWVRNIAWQPSGTAVAFSCGAEAFIWEPLRGPPTVTQRFAIDKEGKEKGKFRVFINVDIRWSADGAFALVACSDGTVEVWNAESNTKWRMMKPQGKTCNAVKGGQFLVDNTKGGGESSGKTLISVDGDGSVRFWDM